MEKVELTLNHMTLDIPLPEGVKADPKLLDGGHPLYYAIKNRRQTEHYLNCVHDLLKDLPKHMDVVELCAGIGLVARSNYDTLLPQSWRGIELDVNCESIFKAVAPCADFELGDMYDFQPELGAIDLMICEFSNNTLPKMWREPKRASLLGRIAYARPKYWYIADVGWYWIHLANHWPIYHGKFGVQVTRDNYVQLFDLFMRHEHGYKVTNHKIGGGAAYILLEPV